MTRVYFLYHIDEKRTDSYHHGKLIGVYSTEERAREAQKRMSDKSGFKDHPDRWRIHGRSLNRDSWVQGFVKETHERIR
jgi:hypothetical protein